MSSTTKNPVMPDTGPTETRVRERIIVQLTMEDYEHVQKEIAEENYRRGMVRGENNLIYHLHKIASGELLPSVIDKASIDPNFWTMLEPILQALTPHKGGSA